MNTKDKEVRTPKEHLLIGQLEMEKGKPVLCVQSRGKKDRIEIGELVRVIRKFMHEE